MEREHDIRLTERLESRIASSTTFLYSFCRYLPVFGFARHSAAVDISIPICSISALIQLNRMAKNPRY
jgi:hypothetical protein